MGMVSEKELSLLNDLLADEELLTKKFKMLAQQTDDKEITRKQIFSNPPYNSLIYKALQP